MSQSDFQLAALFQAIDWERRRRGLSWSAAVREMSAVFVQGGSRPLAVSTVTGLKTKPRAEGDGVLQMLRWLGRTPESFLPGESEDAGSRLPAVGPRQVLRLDTQKLHAALNQQRTTRGLTWQQVAEETRFTISSLAHLTAGGRMGFPQVMRLTRWLNAPLAQFVRITRR